MKLPNQIEKDFIVLGPSKVASIENSDATLYERLDANYDNFIGHELISCYEFEHDWSSWEVHPNGDEIVLLISGNVTFVLQSESGETYIKLSEHGQYVVVPNGVWHTAKVKEKSKLLFVTPGQGTQHKGQSVNA